MRVRRSKQSMSSDDFYMPRNPFYSLIKTADYIRLLERFFFHEYQSLIS